MDLEDKGDLEKAHNALEYKKLKRGNYYLSYR